jgi:hypothetical protein
MEPNVPCLVAALETATAGIMADWMLHRRPAAAHGAPLVRFGIARSIIDQRARTSLDRRRLHPDGSPSITHRIGLAWSSSAHGHGEIGLQARHDGDVLGVALTTPSGCSMPSMPMPRATTHTAAGEVHPVDHQRHQVEFGPVDGEQLGQGRLGWRPRSAGSPPDYAVERATASTREPSGSSPAECRRADSLAIIRCGSIAPAVRSRRTVKGGHWDIGRPTRGTFLPLRRPAARAKSQRKARPSPKSAGTEQLRASERRVLVGFRSEEGSYEVHRSD